ncbi:urease subunit beta [Kribbella sp. NPDC003505]|uniref:urease subunit beta n=1 Tax=Kribbella sp. NPDC003505 TaxID=3154448 RepID=UPI0033AA1836
MADDDRLSKEGQGADKASPLPAPTTPPGAVRVRPGTIRLNADRTDDERLRLVIVNTGDRPIQIGSHLHLPDANAALQFDREAARGFRLDIPSGTSRRFEPGTSREVDLVTLRGNRRVPGIQLKPDTQATPGEVSRG